MKTTSKTVWTKTNLPNLYRHRNQRYYARIFVGGKEIWKGLRTMSKAVAVERLQEHVSNARAQRASGVRLNTGTLTFADVVEQHRKNFQRDAELAEGTKNFREAGIKRIFKSWPGVGELNVRKITTPMVRDWALRLRADATPYVPRGAKRACRNSTGASPTTFNCALDAMRQALDLAVEAGYIFANPARDRSLKRATPKSKRLEIPSREQFLAIVAAIENSGHQQCQAAGELVRFLAYTGARKNEANHVQWKDVDFDAGRITLLRTKNGQPRDVPMILECRSLLEKMRRVRQGEPPNAFVLRVKECRVFWNGRVVW